MPYKKRLRQQFDVPWKHVLEVFLPAFMDLCFPYIADKIDWQKPYESLDKELLTIAPHNLTGNRMVDKLFKVWLKEGQEAWLICHIEVQGQPDPEFPVRMMVYRYRLFDRYRKPVISIATLTDNDPDWRPNLYREQLWGCRWEMEFLIVKLIDFRARKAELVASNNPFCMIVLAHLAALDTYPDEQAKLRTKVILTRMLYDHGWNRDQVLELYRFLDWVLGLPDDLSLEYHHEVERIESEKQMQYITTAERIGIQKGLQQGIERGIEQGIERGIEQGIERGIEQGIEQGRIKGELEVLVRQIQRKFKQLPDVYRQRLEKSDAKTLLKLADRILEAQRLEDLFTEKD